MSTTPYPYITNYGVTVNYVINPTTFVEGTYGRIQNELAGGNENGILVNDESNRLKSLGGLPAAVSAGGCDGSRGTTATRCWRQRSRRSSDGKSLNLPPIFGWGSRIGAAAGPTSGIPAG